ncbi:ThuA domain-containing protein [Roseibacillus ishigakijimensis]|uniref:ThuA domain-containing protein n=1 Tax=Roseibacillus ishigakijimensis TaxID=454146 RepID=A0A934RSC0_9BACT|nr:ThuA domain-containing protein [Roseibacillus ishigakijimensis]MBK1834129.1 ThuA domain-containing protein [Roseibacillus ishigakijimensis]
MKWFSQLTLLTCALALPAAAAEKLQALIVDGQNNHAVWPKSTIMMKQYLEESGLFEVEVARTHFLWKHEREEKWLKFAETGDWVGLDKPKADPDFAPDFSKYDLVVSNFGWNAAAWPEETKRSFEEYMKNGGGLSIVHAANNSWPEWPEFNKMIGLGGWGGRSEKDGPYVYYDEEGNVVRDESPGKCGAHGPQNEFVVTMRVKDHPITQGLPDFWLHTKDECYSHLRGPAENMTILATAADTKALQDAGRHEPMLMTIDYGKGRVFHTTLGHDTEAFEGVGFIVTFLRGSEWAATGEVTQEIPADFPAKDDATHREFEHHAHD